MFESCRAHGSTKPFLEAACSVKVRGFVPRTLLPVQPERTTRAQRECDAKAYWDALTPEQEACRKPNAVIPREGVLSVHTDGSSTARGRHGAIGIRFVYHDQVGNEEAWDHIEDGFQTATNKRDGTRRRDYCFAGGASNLSIKWGKGHYGSNPHKNVADKLAKDSARRAVRPPIAVSTVRRKQSEKKLELQWLVELLVVEQ